MRLLLAALTGAALFLALASAAQAASNGQVINSCKPNDWNRFAEAVETMDAELLAELARAPELRTCEFRETTRVLLCEINPLDCIEPAAGPSSTAPSDSDTGEGGGNCGGTCPGDPGDFPSDEPRSDPPGVNIGVERDHPEPSSGGNDPGSSGGNEPGSSSDDGGNDDGGNDDGGNDDGGGNDGGGDDGNGGID